MDVLPAGHTIGAYRIVRVAGRGAVGVVYEAEHTFTGKRVAVKTMNRNYAGDPEFRARFDREAHGAAAVEHPNITAVFDAGEQDGLPYLVMTYVDGPDLERILEQADGPLDPELVVWVCARVADALDAAAAQGFAHRDVKPANILLESYDPRGRTGSRPHVYLTDFGLTKHNAAATVTRTGQFVGTLLYMAPEQIEGHAMAASDQYSLACVLWECLGGIPPFVPTGASNLSLLTAHLSDPVPSLSEHSNGRFSPRLDRVLARAMAKKAADRYPSCTAFMAAVAEVLDIAVDLPQAPTAAPDPASGGAEPPRRPWPSGGHQAQVSGPADAPRPFVSSGTAGVGGGPPPGQGPAGVQAGSGYGPPGLPPAAGQPGQRPAGLPAGLPPGAYGDSGSGGSGSRWLLIVAAVLVVVGAVIAIVVLSGG